MALVVVAVAAAEWMSHHHNDSSTQPARRSFFGIFFSVILWPLIEFPKYDMVEFESELSLYCVSWIVVEDVGQIFVDDDGTSKFHYKYFKMPWCEHAKDVDELLAITGRKFRIDFT